MYTVHRCTMYIYRHTDIYIYTCVYIHTDKPTVVHETSVCVYIYIERERERQRDREFSCSPMRAFPVVYAKLEAQLMQGEACMSASLLRWCITLFSQAYRKRALLGIFVIFDCKIALGTVLASCSPSCLQEYERVESKQDARDSGLQEEISLGLYVQGSSMRDVFYEAPTDSLEFDCLVYLSADLRRSRKKKGRPAFRSQQD